MALKSPENVLVLVYFYLNDNAFKVVKSSKQGYLKGVPFINRRYTTGVPFLSKNSM